MENCTVSGTASTSSKKNGLRAGRLTQTFRNELMQSYETHALKEAVDRALTQAKKQPPPSEDKKDTPETDTEFDGWNLCYLYLYDL